MWTIFGILNFFEKRNEIKNEAFFEIMKNFKKDTNILWKSGTKIENDNSFQRYDTFPKHEHFSEFFNKFGKLEHFYNSELILIYEICSCFLLNKIWKWEHFSKIVRQHAHFFNLWKKILKVRTFFEFTNKVSKHEHFNKLWNFFDSGNIFYI